MNDWKEEDSWREQLLKEAAQLGKILPAWRLPGPHKKYTTPQRKKRKARRKMSTKSRRINRRK